jgi:exonuclease III
MSKGLVFSFHLEGSNACQVTNRHILVVCGDFNARSNEVPLEAIRGDVENTGNSKLVKRVMVPWERTIPKPSRYSLFLPRHRQNDRPSARFSIPPDILCGLSSEIHNEVLHDESITFTDDKLFPESDHAPIAAEFQMLDF